MVTELLTSVLNTRRTFIPLWPRRMSIRMAKWILSLLALASRSWLCWETEMVPFRNRLWAPRHSIAEALLSGMSTPMENQISLWAPITESLFLKETAMAPFRVQFIQIQRVSFAARWLLAT